MYLYKIEEYLSNKDVFIIEPINLRKDWNSYFNQYHNATLCLLNKSVKNSYGLNYIFMPVMQILRHSYELLVKSQCITKGVNDKAIFESHDLEYLSNLCGMSIVLPYTFKDTNGDLFKYTHTNSSRLHFTEHVISLLDDCLQYVNVTEELNSCICHDPTLFSELHFENRFVVYPHECTSLGAVSTQYDEALRILLDCIIEKYVTINDLFLPVLFLLRHSLELKLKVSLQNLGNVIEKDKIIRLRHNLTKLWNILSSKLSQAIDALQDSNFKTEGKVLLENVNKYIGVMAYLDANSKSLRYPETSFGNVCNLPIEKTMVVNSLRLASVTDSFLCFGFEVLAEVGALQLGVDILHELFD